MRRCVVPNVACQLVSNLRSRNLSYRRMLQRRNPFGCILPGGLQLYSLKKIILYVRFTATVPKWGSILRGTGPASSPPKYPLPTVGDWLLASLRYVLGTSSATLLPLNTEWNQPNMVRSYELCVEAAIWENTGFMCALSRVAGEAYSSFVQYLFYKFHHPHSHVREGVLKRTSCP